MVKKCDEFEWNQLEAVVIQKQQYTIMIPVIKYRAEEWATFVNMQHMDTKRLLVVDPYDLQLDQ